MDSEPTYHSIAELPDYTEAAWKDPTSPDEARRHLERIGLPEELWRDHLAELRTSHEVLSLLVIALGETPRSQEYLLAQIPIVQNAHYAGLRDPVHQSELARCATAAARRGVWADFIRVNHEEFAMYAGEAAYFKSGSMVNTLGQAQEYLQEEAEALAWLIEPRED